MRSRQGQQEQQDPGFHERRRRRERNQSFATHLAEAEQKEANLNPVMDDLVTLRRMLFPTTTKASFLTTIRLSTRP